MTDSDSDLQSIAEAAASADVQTTRPPTDEMSVMRRITTALAPLDVRTQQRIVAYLLDRYLPDTRKPTSATAGPEQR